MSYRDEGWALCKRGSKKPSTHVPRKAIDARAAVGWASAMATACSLESTSHTPSHAMINSVSSSVNSTVLQEDTAERESDS
jgi:hypothetical protein